MATNSGRRIDRLLVVLTPKERAVLVLRAWKQGREPDKRITQASRSAQEAYEYNRIVDMLQVASGDLTHYLACIHLLVGQLELRYSWYLTTLLWGLESDPNERADEIGEALLRGLVEGVAMRWRELGALDEVLDEIADEVDGEDVLHPDARELFERMREQIQKLHSDLAAYGKSCELLAPAAEDIAPLWALVGKKV